MRSRRGPEEKARGASASDRTDERDGPLATAGALVSLGLFTLAAWGLFKATSSWERVTSAGGITGLVALVPYGIAASSTDVSGPGLNSAIHIAGSATVLLVLLVPALERRMRAWLPGAGRRGKPQQASPWPGTDPRRR